jgi:hypothetical protein
MNQLMRFEDLREWLVSQVSDSVEVVGEDSLILDFIRKLDAAPFATAATDRPDWARQLPGAEIFDRAHGYDRTASINAGHYVCLCGGACSRPDARHESPHKEK